MKSTTDSENQGMARTKELNENNFIKKLKTLSKTNTEITVRSLKAPSIKTDLYNVDTMRILSQGNDVPARRYERNDHLTFKSTKSKRDNKDEFAKEQMQNHKFY